MLINWDMMFHFSLIYSNICLLYHIPLNSYLLKVLKYNSDGLSRYIRSIENGKKN